MREKDKDKDDSVQMSFSEFLGDDDLRSDSSDEESISSFNSSDHSVVDHQGFLLISSFFGTLETIRH